MPLPTSSSGPPRISRSPTASRRAPLSITPVVPPSPTTLLIPVTHHSVNAAQALGIPLRFHVVQDVRLIQGYQLYAVEKWIVERNRAITTLVVYTGDPSHKISVTMLRPSPDLSPSEAQSDWDKALNHLRRDGARPKDTQLGVLMTTSLAHFRSDYTIVHIPDGNFLAVREQLYTNINLLRMGCSSRSALTLEEPSETTKDRFISSYHLPESILAIENASPEYLQLPVALIKPRSRSHSRSASVLSFGSPGKRDMLDHASPISSISKGRLPIGLGYPSSHQSSSSKSLMSPKSAKDYLMFIQTVLELVRLVQSGLAIAGMYRSVSGNPVLPYLDGLLCDETVEGIRRWIVEIGDPCVGLEPMERVVDPNFVAALLSITLATRNKLSAIGFTNFLPKDPFLQPQIFCGALAAYSNQSTNPSGAASAWVAGAYHHPLAKGTTRAGSVLAPHIYSPPQISPSSSSGSSSTLAFLTRELVAAIGAAYDAKARIPDGRGGGQGGRVGKLREKLRQGGDSENDLSTVGGREWDRGATSGGEGDKAADGERELLGGVGMAVSSGSGQFLSGIGSFATGLGLGMGGGGASATAMSPALLFEGTCDMAWFAKVIAAKDRKGKGRMGKDKNRDGDILGVGYAYAYRGKEKEKDGGVGISVRALWGGGLLTLVKLREWEIEREKLGAAAAAAAVRSPRKDKSAVSDGDVEDSPAPAARSETEEESDNVGGGAGFGGVWGKLESWTGIAKRRGHMSFEMSTSRTDVNDPGAKTTVRPSMERSATVPVSPTLAPTVVLGHAYNDGEDDDMLSSGQVSPIDNLRPSPFQVLQDNRSLENTFFSPNTANADYERKVNEFDQKRKFLPSNRISSWADPLSAHADEHFLHRKERSNDERKKRENMLRPSVLAKEPREISIGWSEGEGKCERPGGWQAMGPVRRWRSFHDLDSVRSMTVLPVDRMKIDVELCGQLLIMYRREPHLQDVISCLRVLLHQLTRTNTLLKEDYKVHLPTLSLLEEERVQIISTIESENAKADQTSQATHTLRYEAEQFRLPHLWHTAMPPREKVLELREKVFGTGGRRLAPGVRGAHGRFNRLQWSLDSQERLVNSRGRTESEAEEEAAGEDYLGLRREEEDEEEVITHHVIKPMWLLHFFTSWVVRWRAASAAPPADGTNNEENDVPSSVNGKSKDD